MTYYALENVVYKENGEVACVISPVWMRKSLAKVYAQYVATSLNDCDMDERDVLRGSLD